MKMTREFYIPKGARKVAPKTCAGVVFYAYERGDKLYGMCFIGKAQKPAWHFRFRNEAERTRRFADQVASIAARDAVKAARRAEDAKPHSWETGMILVGSWGYEQTNVNFFEVVRIVGKNFVEVEQIGSQSATDAGEGSWATDRVVPDVESRTGKISRCRVSRGSIKSPVYGYASVWDGKPKYESSYH